MYIIQLCTTLGGPNELVTFPDDVKSRLKREKNLVSSRATCLLLWLYLAMYLKWQAKEEEEEERGPATDYNRKRKTKKKQTNSLLKSFLAAIQENPKKGVEKECAKTRNETSSSKQEPMTSVVGTRGPLKKKCRKRNKTSPRR